MTRRTITITAPNGAKVRTVASKTYFVVRFHEVRSTYNSATQEFESHEPKQIAEVIKRTNSILTAYSALRTAPATRRVYRYSPSAAPEYQVLPIEDEVVAQRAETERANKKFAASVGNNGPARSLQY